MGKLSSDPWPLCKKPGTVGPWKHTAEGWLESEARRVPETHWPASSAKRVSLRFTEGPYIKEGRTWQMNIPDMHTCILTHKQVHPNTHAYIHTQHPHIHRTCLTTLGRVWLSHSHLSSLFLGGESIEELYSSPVAPAHCASESRSTQISEKLGIILRLV